ncbi:MAG: hypothetical protein E6R03_12430 [Hyphomicrobiaceae bacterium]|nr:MAG: hypothetical protein E6R03_12430 [Hyphomicrobiaceae bacterium]
MGEDELRDRTTRIETRFDAFVERYERDQATAREWRKDATAKLDQIADWINQGKGVARAVGFGRWALLALASLAGLVGLPKLAVWLGAAAGE